MRHLKYDYMKLANFKISFHEAIAILDDWSNIYDWNWHLQGCEDDLMKEPKRTTDIFSPDQS